MTDNNREYGSATNPISSVTRLARRRFLRGTGSVVVGGLGVTALATPVAAGTTVDLEVKSNINLESGGVIPAVVKGVAPMFLPVPQPGASETIIGPRFGPSRLFDCDPQGDPAPLPVPEPDGGERVILASQQRDEDLCALEQAIQNDDGASPLHGDGHRRGKRSAMLHFRTQEAGFVSEDMVNGEVEVTLLYAVEEANGDVKAFVGTDLAKALPTPEP